MRYIGLLRAVNVGGKKKIKMAELRDALATLDLQHMRTYIQSGNILFDSDDTEDSLQQRIEHHIEQRFGFPVDIVLRALPEFDSLVADCSFAEYAARHMSSLDLIGLYVAFLNKTPPADAIAALTNYVGPKEQFQLHGRDMYLLLQRGVAQSKLDTRVQKMGSVATLRNWKTVLKLHDLAHSA